MNQWYVFLFVEYSYFQESIQQSLDGVAAVENVWEQDRHDAQQQYIASKQELFDSIGLNIGYVIQFSCSIFS